MRVTYQVYPFFIFMCCGPHVSVDLPAPVDLALRVQAPLLFFRTHDVLEFCGNAVRCVSGVRSVSVVILLSLCYLFDTIFGIPQWRYRCRHVWYRRTYPIRR